MQISQLTGTLNMFSHVLQDIEVVQLFGSQTTKGLMTTPGFVACILN